MEVLDCIEFKLLIVTCRVKRTLVCNPVFTCWIDICPPSLGCKLHAGRDITTVFPSLEKSLVYESEK